MQEATFLFKWSFQHKLFYSILETICFIIHLKSHWFTKSVWFVGCTSCTLQTLYAWLVRRFICLYGWNPYLYGLMSITQMCDSWHATMLLI